jgi:hypothetical protein
MRQGGMSGMNIAKLLAGCVLLMPGAAVTFAAPPVKLTPATMPRVGTVDERFQSYNIEMVEVTGGRFWKPARQERFHQQQVSLPRISRQAWILGCTSIGSLST